MSAKNWCFTLNNFDDGEIQTLRDVAPSVRYLIFQQEIGKEGTKHLQGYISLHKKQRLSGLKKLVGDRAHLEMARGTPKQNRDYCTKKESAVENSMEEFGEIPNPSGHRSDLENFKQAVAEGNCDRKRLREEHSEIYAKYPRFCESFILDNVALPPVEEHEMTQWQRDLKLDLFEDPNDREVVFVVDKQGGKGKTWFAKKYCSENDNAQYMEPAKKADMAYILQENIRVLFINLTRSQVEKSEYLYSFLESVKDGMVFSLKYEFCVKYIGKCYVVVMMNIQPNLILLFSDWYKIINI